MAPTGTCAKETHSTSAGSASVKGFCCYWVRPTSLKPVSSASALTRSGAHAHTCLPGPPFSLPHLPPSLTSNYPELSLGPTGKALQQAYSSSSQPSRQAARGRRGGQAGRQLANGPIWLAGLPPCHPRPRALCFGHSTSQFMLTSQGLDQQ